jgi:hypothetical protein
LCSRGEPEQEQWRWTWTAWKSVHAPGQGDDTIAAIAEVNRDVVVVTARA